MPFIRYRIGDFGSISNSCCSCGRPGLLLKKVSGRVTDVFKASLGKIVPAEYFIHIIGVVQNKGAIKKFQVIQKKLNVILIKIVKDNTLEDRELDDIKTKLQLVMGTDCQFEFEFVEEIPPLASGKYRYTIREIE
jgi:phenylacetate-CoA ligase